MSDISGISEIPGILSAMNYRVGLTLGDAKTIFENMGFKHGRRPMGELFSCIDDIRDGRTLIALGKLTKNGGYQLIEEGHELIEIALVNLKNLFPDRENGEHLCVLDQLRHLVEKHPGCLPPDFFYVPPIFSSQ